MTDGLQSLIDTGTKVWLDSVDPDEVARNAERGVTGATSNPAIISSLIKSGRFDEHLGSLLSGMNDEAAAWGICDYLVSKAQEVFQPVWDKTGCNDGWVSFELDPLIDDDATGLPHDERVRRYISLGRHWASGYTNRMIKVPATPAGIEAIETLAAEGITLNITLIFTARQYREARDAVWRGAQRRRHGLDRFKSVYSVFISRIDVYADESLSDLSDEAKRLVGVVNAKRLWAENEAFWADKKLPLEQEIIFASTGAKLKWQEPDYYIRHVAGGGIQTNPPETNDAIADGGATFEDVLNDMPSDDVLLEIDSVDMAELERVLMSEGLDKFSKPQRQLLAAVKEQRSKL